MCVLLLLCNWVSKVCSLVECSTLYIEMFQNGIEIDKCSGGVTDLTFPLIFFQTCTLFAQSCTIGTCWPPIGTKFGMRDPNSVSQVCAKSQHRNRAFRRFLLHQRGPISAKLYQTHRVSVLLNNKQCFAKKIESSHSRAELCRPVLALVLPDSQNSYYLSKF